MLYCPKCGSRYETGKFKCPNCGSLLAYESSNRRPPFWVRFKGYKNLLILLFLAIIIMATRVATVLTTIYWIFIVGLLIMALVFWLRGRGRKVYYPQQNRSGNNSAYSPRGKSSRKAANVIPFKKRHGNGSKTKQDQ